MSKLGNDNAILTDHLRAHADDVACQLAQAQEQVDRLKEALADILIMAWPDAEPDRYEEDGDPMLDIAKACIDAIDNKPTARYLHNAGKKIERMLATLIKIRPYVAYADSPSLCAEVADVINTATE